MPLHKYNSRSGFTLIELLTVIAIIGILASILVPTLGKVRETAQRAVDASNLREIGKAALLYAADHQDRLPDPAAPAAASIIAPNRFFTYLGLLAQGGGLNEASLYFSRNDSQFDGTVPHRVINPADPTGSTLHPDLLARIPSINLVGGLKMSDPATTPLAYTRGLNPAGLWNGTSNDSNQGTYGDGGGHVLYLGNSVQFFRRIDNKLADTRGNPTSDLRAAIKAGGNRKIYGLDNANGVASPDGTDPTGMD